MLYYWLICVIIGIILVGIALYIKSSSAPDVPFWFWVLFFAGIIFVFIGCFLATSHTVEAGPSAGEYVYYKPQWYTQAVDYPYLNKPLPRECEYVQPVSDQACSPCYSYNPPGLL